MEEKPRFELLTCPEVAEKLHISESFAYRLVQTGQLPGVKIGRSIRVKMVDLENYIERNTQNQIG